PPPRWRTPPGPARSASPRGGAAPPGRPRRGSRRPPPRPCPPTPPGGPATARGGFPTLPAPPPGLSSAHPRRHGDLLDVRRGSRRRRRRGSRHDRGTGRQRTLQLEQLPLAVDTAGVAREPTVGGDDAVARHDHAERVARDEL